MSTKANQNQNNPRLSVIIPCFNLGAFIREAIESVEAFPGEQTYEIIIVNDGSTDDFTCKVLQDLKSEGYLVIDQVNQGPAAARNTAIRSAKSEYILPLDADNKIRPDYIQKGIDILDQNPEIGVVYGNAQYFGEKTGVWEMSDFNLTRLINANYIDACAVFRRSLWEKCGGYDEKMPVFGFEDWDLWLSAARKGYKFHYVPEILFDYRVRDGSVSGSKNRLGQLKKSSKQSTNTSTLQYIALKHFDFFHPEYRRYVKLYLRLILKEILNNVSSP
jgi:glycosyltransferase involved in cell wall biosynthesis